jgi:type II secretory ATPase GspE/PulE/Tfp pilus assembly ATPase PilB-like protein/ActR/RegA family two-component response regulator
MGDTAAHVHWLVDVAVRAGLLQSGALAVAPNAALPDAWARVSAACSIDEKALARLVATRYKVAIAELSATTPAILSLVPEKVARRNTVFPIRASDRQITVATADPTNIDLEQAIGFACARTPVFEIAPPTAIEKAIDTRYSPDRLVERLVGRVGTDMAGEVRLLEELTPESMSSQQVDATPVVKLANLILHEAVRAGASDIHLEPGGGGGVVRFRVDGVLRTAMQVPTPVLNRIVSRIKIMGKLDISDRLRPQDGRARLQVENHTLDLRISTVPTRDAEKAVIRLLDPRNAKALADLAVPPDDLVRIRRLLAFREGIVVVTGPTGSGKTTLLYAALRELVTGQVNIMTVEDPIEYELPGLTQIQVETRRDVTFAKALRSILRQDPDVVFVGEIRDRETAEIAVQASLTGHLVLATLHANDAVGAVARFIDLGIDRSKIAATLRGSVAQRLARRVCPQCVRPIAGPLTPDETRLAARYGALPLVRASGCSNCTQSGYRGRLPLLEVLVSNPMFSELVAAGGSPAQLLKAASVGGFRSLRESAVDRVRNRETTLQEVERVVGNADDSSAAVPSEDARPSPIAASVGGPHVLVVDDDSVSRTLARTLLMKNGFRVSEASDGAAALELLGKNPGFTLMVLDLEMPIMGGREVLERVRKSVATVALPIIVLTSTASEELEAQLMEEGADDYIRKPLEPARFVARVKAALRRAVTTESLAA